MICVDKRFTNFLWTFFVVLISFCIGYIHHRWFFPLSFHGDAAAMDVLAKAILDEQSFLPYDFSYGNQLVFLRSSPFITVFLFFGMTGYKAFIFGSALSIAFWGTVLYHFLYVYFELKSKAFLFTLLVLFPIGMFDADYILGQQSHLSNIVLSFGIVISIQKYILKANIYHLVSACICLFIMSSEAPIRGMLVIVPILIITLLTTNRRTFCRVIFTMTMAFAMAFLVNKVLLYFHPVAFDILKSITFKTSNEILKNLSKTTEETIYCISNINLLAGKHLRPVSFIIYLSGIFFVIANISFIFTWMLKAMSISLKKLSCAENLEYSLPTKNFDFISLTASLGVISGALAVSSLNPDSSRHYLWAITLVKFCLFIFLYDIMLRLFKKNIAIVIIIVTSLLPSSWLATLSVYNWNTKSHIVSRNYTDVVRKIEEISRKKNIRNIYGEDFWRMMPLNTLLHDINAQSILFDGKNLNLMNWLTRPSWAHVQEDVLYYLKNGSVDREIENKLILIGGEKVYDGNEYALWVGPPVWRLSPSAQ